MDIDVVEEGPKSSNVVIVDEEHPFDLDAYISNYSGRTAVDRLIHIIRKCPALAIRAYQLAVQRIQSLRDPVLYTLALSAYESHLSYGLPPAMEVASLPPHWIEEIEQANGVERQKLEVELKTYTSNMIKESIRMAHRDLADHCRATGDHAGALKHYTKSREYCTTSQHVLDMCLSVLELLIEQRNYSHIPTFVFKADTALDAAANQQQQQTDEKSAAAPNAGSAVAKKPSADREKIQPKLDLAIALSHFGLGSYEKAAFSFLKVGSPPALDNWLGTLVAPGDIALYGTLCALATLPRSSVQSRILQSSTFTTYLVSSPTAHTLATSYLASQFASLLSLLTSLSTSAALDIHLAAHAKNLENHIKDKAVCLYFKPFGAVRMESMGKALGWDVETVEREVVRLIQKGEIEGRVDSQNKILREKKTDQRAELFARAVKAAKEMEGANQKLMLRMKLQQADLGIKAPKAERGMHLNDDPMH